MEPAISSANLIDRLLARVNYERQPCPVREFKLNGLRRLLDRLQQPHLAYPVIHVAGTKGKGSVSACIGSILSTAGLKVGVYSSPHLERINQRIVIDGAEISDETMIDVLKRMDPVVYEFDEQAQQSGTRKLTFFEIMTAAALQAFCDAAMDAVVLEVGMGGRLDSTNVCQPEICVITNISLDHTRQLGSTVEQIAREKAGIIKPGVPVVNGSAQTSTQAVIREISDTNGSPLFQLQQDFWMEQDRGRPQRFSYVEQIAGVEKRIDDLECGMIGKHQLVNSALAVSTCQRLINKGWKISPEDIRRGLQRTRLPGRCELFRKDRLIVLDIAHNPASTQALAETLQSDIPDFMSTERKTLILAVSRDKDAAAMFAPLAGLFNSIILTRYVDNPRGRDALDLYELVRPQTLVGQDGIAVTISDDPAAAWQQALSENHGTHAICIAGSAFLVAELRPLVVDWASNR